MAVTKIRIPNECINSFLGDTGKLEQGRGRESTMVASTACVPWEQLHRPQNICQTWRLPLRPKLQDKQRGSFTERLVGGGYTSIHCLCSAPGVGSLPRTISPVAIVLWDPGMQAILATKAKWSRGVSWAVMAKIRTPWCSGVWQRVSSKMAWGKDYLHSAFRCMFK